MTGDFSDLRRLERAECIRWIAFDAVGTLIYADPPVADVYHRVARKHGLRLTVEQIGRRFRAAFQRSEQDDFGTSEIWTHNDRLTTSEQRERERWHQVVTSVLSEAEDSDACFEELFADFEQPAAWKCFSDVAETLKLLQQSGYHLAVASNFDVRLHTICDGLPELKPLDLRVLSSLVGYRKPSVHFYRALAQAAGCRMEEILMVGDDPVNDLRGACQAGCSSIQIRRQLGASDMPQISNLRELVGVLGL